VRQEIGELGLRKSRVLILIDTAEDLIGAGGARWTALLSATVTMLTAGGTGSAPLLRPVAVLVGHRLPPARPGGTCAITAADNIAATPARRIFRHVHV